MSDDSAPSKVLDPPSRLANAGLFTLWWAMVEVDRELSGDGKFDDGELVLHFSGSGASCMVFAKDIRAVCRLVNQNFDRHPLTDADIVSIRDAFLPSQGESFDCIAFAHTLLVAAEQGVDMAVRGWEEYRNLRAVYEAARGYVAIQWGVDEDKTVAYMKRLDDAVESVKALDGGYDERYVDG